MNDLLIIGAYTGWVRKSGGKPSRQCAGLVDQLKANPTQTLQREVIGLPLTVILGAYSNLKERLKDKDEGLKVLASRKLSWYNQ